MNPDLARLHPYPFERLRQLLAGATPPAHLAPINLSIGEPRHPTPAFILEAYRKALPSVSSYPQTAGQPELREAIAAWVRRRYGLRQLDPGTQVLPVAGSREALFAFAQAAIDRSRTARVISPNPFYQIYEGAAVLAGAQPLYLPTTAGNGFRMEFERLSPLDWAGVQLVYVCTPGNPTGRVMTLDEWGRLFELADRHGFIIASDECYSEIYFDEARPPLGALAAAAQLGRDRFERVVMFSSLSKRSNVPGMRSGFVAGDAELLRRFLLYRTYHGAALSPPVQAASMAAWNDEAHVVENRRLYAAKFDQATPVIAGALPCQRPDAAFYLWARTPIADTEYARRLFAERHVTVLPGSFLSREADGLNPGAGFVRIALVATPDEVAEAAARIASFKP
ncbi:MAG: succinyldiaminopimelate transaminase [Burkholderiaceae bacterium]|jgi:N-succinyldiaminopimelate aminotransferase|nr:succinyldiaminopimelate transaminase [Burkholderiaceae bacterium]